MTSLTSIDNFTSTRLVGYFPSTAALNATYPVGGNGWFAIVGKDRYGWDLLLHRWVSNTISDVNWSDMYSFILVSSSGVINVNYTITKVDTTSGTITLTLPTAVGFVGELNILKVDSTLNTVIVVPFGAETISGETSQTIYGQFDNMTIVSDNSNWLII